eukprot:m.52270 g.52270  ORF g.52270 m.52270 type:complete len:333 (-) comp7361_c0_seq3:303-1301(-)
MEDQDRPQASRADLGKSGDRQSVAYPRDMVGYGSARPRVVWPGNAILAVQFVINYEEGGESSILHGDAESEHLLTEVNGLQPVVGQRSMNAESMYEYGSRCGFWRLHRLFTERDMPVTVFGVAMALERNPTAVRAMMDAGWEVASHGYRWIDYQDVPVDVERDHIRRAVEVHTAVTGQRPLGMYQGKTSINTRRLVAEEGGFVYDADNYSDELPFWLDDLRRDEIPHLVVPYTLDANDFRFGMPGGFNNGDDFYTYLKDTFDQMYLEGSTHPDAVGVMSVGLHCRISGRPGRARALARFLDYVKAHDRVWVCRRIDIARHWHSHYPPSPRAD